MRIYIWAGLKSHSEGQHDYPQFLADWSKLLTGRGAVVDGALHPPSIADLEHADVVVISEAPDAETMLAQAAGVAGTGNTRTETLRAFTLDEVDQALQKLK